MAAVTRQKKTPDANGGFRVAGVETWLPVNSNRTTINVQVQEQDSRSTLHFYQDLLAIRRQSSALRGGSICFLADLGLIAKRIEWC